MWNKNTLFVYLIISLSILVFLISFSLFLFERTDVSFNKPTIMVGILHSFTGTMALSEKPIADVELFAIEELNKSGGILGKKIVPVIADGRSDPDVFAKEAERLITKDKVNVIFGCGTSSSRKAVKPIVEKFNSLLFYHLPYEGLESSQNIIYMGAAPNQLIVPAVKWSCDNLGKRFFFVGSDSIFSRMTNKIAGDVVGFSGGKVVGEEYVRFGGKDFTAITGKISRIKPDIILSSVKGESNFKFLEALYNAGISSSKTKIILLSMTGWELSQMKDRFTKDHLMVPADFLKKHFKEVYACENYFETIKGPVNEAFVAKFKGRFGRDFPVTDPMEAAYFGVKLWGQAAQETGDLSCSSIVNHLHTISVAAPEGIISISDNNNARKTVRVGKLNSSGSFDIIWTSDGPVEPDQYPNFHDNEYWRSQLETFYEKWNGQWVAPGAEE